MLSPMQKDTAVEVAATLLANIYRDEKKDGRTKETASDEDIVLGFKERVSENTDIKWSDVLEFSKTWLAKYPSATPKKPV